MKGSTETEKVVEGGCEIEGYRIGIDLDRILKKEAQQIRSAASEDDVLLIPSAKQTVESAVEVLATFVSALRKGE